MILALVPARRGSKGFPKKNLARIGGDSLVAIAYRKLVMLKGLYPDLTLRLSTDSPEIADEWGEDPGPLRPDILSGDTTTSEDVIRYEMDMAGADTCLLFQVTTPLINHNDLRCLWSAWSTARSATCVKSIASEWVMTARDGMLDWLIPQVPSRRRQDLKPAYMPIGIAMFDRDKIGVPGRPVLIPDCRAIDVDTYEDLEIARAIAKSDV